MADRMFIGDLGGGTYGCRISKPGKNATSGPASDMLFDSRWAFAGNIHAAGWKHTPNKKKVTINFPALPYIPAVYAYRSFWRGNRYDVIFGGAQAQYSIDTFNNRMEINVQGPDAWATDDDVGFYYVVLRAPMMDLSQNVPAASGTNRVLIGKRGSSYGFFVSQPGRDVQTCAKSELVFDSDDPPRFNIYKNYWLRARNQFDPGDPKEGTIPIARAQGEISFPSQGYLPAIILMAPRVGDTSNFLQPWWVDNTTNPQMIRMSYVRVWKDRLRVWIMGGVMSNSGYAPVSVLVSDYPVG